MGANLSKKNKNKKCNCALYITSKHCCQKICFSKTSIKNAQKMNDILEIGWIFTKRHENYLIQCLKQYNSEYILNIITAFLPNYKQPNTLNIAQSDHVYHAYINANISSMFNHGKAPCKFWLNSLGKVCPFFSLYNHKTGKMEPLSAKDYPGINPNKVPSIKVAVMGDGAVGKSALTLRHITNKFVDEYDPTIEDCYRKLIELNPNDNDMNAFKITHKFPNYDRNDWNELYKYAVVDILDTAGQNECWGFNSNRWMRDYSFFLLCFAVNSRKSFEHLSSYIDDILVVKDLIDIMDSKNKFHQSINFGLMIIGTKCDLRYDDDYEDKVEGNTFVSSKEALELAKKWNVPYIETSALTGRNVNFVFRQLCYEFWIQSQTNSLLIT